MLLLGTLGVACTGYAALGQIQYQSQLRRVDAQGGGGHPIQDPYVHRFAESHDLVEFNQDVFYESGASRGEGSQHSTLTPNLISASGRIIGGGLNSYQGYGSSNLDVTFTVRFDRVFTLSGDRPITQGPPQGRTIELFENGSPIAQAPSLFPDAYSFTGLLRRGQTYRLHAYLIAENAGFPAADPDETYSYSLSVNPLCIADVDDGSGTGTPDDGVTIDDLLFYLTLFAAGDARADIDNGSGTGTPDGGVTIEDLLYFVQRYEAGC